MQLFVRDSLILRRAEKEVTGGGLLSYTLYEERGLRGEPTQYGIEIVKRDADGVETERIPSITTDRGFATRLFRAVVLGEVTPCTLVDIVLDAVSVE